MGKRHNKKFKNRQKGYYQNMQMKKTFNNRNHGDETTNKSEFIVKQSLREDQVGITEYISKGEGFKGILKSRFSDFHVNEIDLNGDILQLNDLVVPDEKEEDLSAEELNLAKEEFKDIIPEDVWNQMEKLKEAKHDNNENPEDSAIIFDISQLNKEQRTRAHRMIKKLYEGKLVSSTISGEHAPGKEADIKSIRVMKSKGRDRNKWLFPKEYVQFLVHKENLDTSEVASVIAKKMNLRPSQVNYCGTKDKRAKTTQKFCIKKRTPRQIAGTVKFLNGVTIGNFKFKKSVLKLGDLHGNRFRIAIRNLAGERHHIETLLNSVKEHGFINYFGLQRFGNCSAIPTHEIGVALLKADYKLACELILKPRDGDAPFLKNIREMWWKNRNSKAAAAQFRGEGFIEKKLLTGLAQYGENDYAAALRKIPRNMLLLYPHAFQSLIFNNIASRRIKEFGLSLIAGDLVYRDRDYREIEMELPEEEDNIEKETENTEDNIKKETEFTEDNIKKEMEFTEDNIKKETESTEEDNIENATSTMANEKNFKSVFRRKVRPLTEEDIASAAYTIYDVLLPLPGHDITYPENIVGTWYRELLEKYELSSEKLKHNVKLFSMAGAYRRLVVKPRDMSWEFKFYSSPDETLILSDVELLEGKKLEDFKNDTGDTKYEALLLDFCLPTASYATMLLRELLKCDTSAGAQSLLQQEALKEHAVLAEVQEETQKVGEKRKANDNKDEEESFIHTKISKTCEPTK